MFTTQEPSAWVWAYLVVGCIYGLPLKKLPQKVFQRFIVVIVCLITYQKFTKIWPCEKYYFQDGVQDGCQIPKIPIICSLIIRNDSFWCNVTCFGCNMVHRVHPTHHRQKGRQTANFEGNNNNHSLHHFVSTILLQKLAQVEWDCRSLDFKICLYTAWT